MGFVILLIPVAIAALLYLVVPILETRILFPARTMNLKMPPLPEGAFSHRLDTPGGSVDVIFLPAYGASESRPAPLLLYAHGNNEFIDFQIDKFEALRKAGISVMMAEYPGYGRSTGVRRESSIRDSQLAAYDWASSLPIVDKTRIAAQGRSLGGGAVSTILLKRPFAVVAFESTFTSVPDVARHTFGILSNFLRNQMSVKNALSQYQGPVLIIHGTRDHIVPYSHAEALHKACPQSKLVTLDCRHNDCIETPELVYEFMTEHLLGLRKIHEEHAEQESR